MSLLATSLKNSLHLYLFFTVYLVLDVCVLEDKRQWCDVLSVHTLTTSKLDGMLDAFVNLSRVGLPKGGH